MSVYFTPPPPPPPAMARTVADFKQSYNIKKKSEKDTHYELTGSSNKLLTTNVKLMVEAMKKIGVFFNDSDDVQHVLSHSVLQQNQGLLNLREIGEKAEDEFIEKRILGTESVWATIKKLNSTCLETLSNQ